jgi:hypothetical protein
MHRLVTSIEISAPADRVWSLLMDFPAYPRWNPFVRSIEGTPSAGGSLKVFIQPPGSGGMWFRPEVLACEPEREFRWKGKLWMAGFFDAEHYFKLEPKAPGAVLFGQGEVFSGLLVPLFRRSLDGATKQGFMLMNEALKREAENQ